MSAPHEPLHEPLHEPGEEYRGEAEVVDDQHADGVAVQVHLRGHFEPIDPETSSTSERSTMRRCASPSLDTVTCWKFARRMNVVGRTAVARTVTTLTPVVLSVRMSKKLASVAGFVTDDTPM